MASQFDVDTSMGMSHEDYSRAIAEKQAWAAMKETSAQFETQMRGLGIDKQLLGNQ